MNRKAQCFLVFSTRLKIFSACKPGCTATKEVLAQCGMPSKRGNTRNLNLNVCSFAKILCKYNSHCDYLLLKIILSFLFLVFDLDKCQPLKP